MNNIWILFHSIQFLQESCFLEFNTTSPRRDLTPSPPATASHSSSVLYWLLPFTSFCHRFSQLKPILTTFWCLMLNADELGDDNDEDFTKMMMSLYKFYLYSICSSFLREDIFLQNQNSTVHCGRCCCYSFKIFSLTYIPLKLKYILIKKSYVLCCCSCYFFALIHTIFQSPSPIIVLFKSVLFELSFREHWNCYSIWIANRSWIFICWFIIPIVS